ncbi:hypothetical protein CHU95_00555 [Niveispirillum lacus]|uniref:Uncharacterized protein n=1 Tax=Niveispirillum lacus TaxID=1981099 RepID=A0A255ZAP9_9PROT|nr:hypothetical protein CHU95_00555 [Niveispirillum lacus]
MTVLWANSNRWRWVGLAATAVDPAGRRHVVPTDPNGWEAAFAGLKTFDIKLLVPDMDLPPQEGATPDRLFDLIVGGWTKRAPRVAADRPLDIVQNQTSFFASVIIFIVGGYPCPANSDIIRLSPAPARSATQSP